MAVEMSTFPLLLLLLFAVTEVGGSKLRCRDSRWLRLVAEQCVVVAVVVVHCDCCFESGQRKSPNR